MSNPIISTPEITVVFDPIATGLAAANAAAAAAAQTAASSGAEDLREAAEGARVIAETGRVDAEALRVSAETDRATAEELRVTAESRRVDAEAARVEQIDTVTGATPEIALAHNREYRCGVVTALTITLPETVPQQFIAHVVFASGETAATVTYPASVAWSGDNIDADGAFVPIVSKRYAVTLWYDGTAVRGIARGVSTL